MNILKDLLSEVPQQALELSQNLHDEFQALRNESADFNISLQNPKAERNNMGISRIKSKSPDWFRDQIVDKLKKQIHRDEAMSHGKTT